MAIITSRNVNNGANANDLSFWDTVNKKYVAKTVAEAQTILGIDTKAESNDVVALTGNQTVGGIKTFTSIPVGPTSDPTTDNQLTRKAYVDTKTVDTIKNTGGDITNIEVVASLPAPPDSKTLYIILS